MSLLLIVTNGHNHSPWLWDCIKLIRYVCIFLFLSLFFQDGGDKTPNADNGSNSSDVFGTPPDRPLPTGPTTRPLSNQTDNMTNGFKENTNLMKRKAFSVGSKPNKPLPKLDSLTDDDVFSGKTGSLSSRSQPPVILEDGEDVDVDVEVMFCFTRKLRLPKNFTLEDLKCDAAEQSIPNQFEFRLVSSNESVIKKLLNEKTSRLYSSSSLS